MIEMFATKLAETEKIMAFINVTMAILLVGMDVPPLAK